MGVLLDQSHEAWDGVRWYALRSELTMEVTDEFVLCGCGCVLEGDSCGAGLAVVPVIRGLVNHLSFK